MFMDGQEVASVTTKMSRSGSGAADGRVVVGKLFSVGEHYASVEIDELIFFNQTLSPDQIKALNENSFPWIKFQYLALFNHVILKKE